MDPRSRPTHVLWCPVRIVVADCAVVYRGRLDARLPRARRVLMVKADGSVLVHSDGGSYKPLNWMSPPCAVVVRDPAPDEPGVVQHWTVSSTRTEDTLEISVYEIEHDVVADLGVDPGLEKDGVEAHLQRLLAAHPETVAAGCGLVRREFPTAVGPVDLLLRDPAGGHVAVEVKRRGDIDGVEQLSRYLDLLNRDPLLSPVRGVLAAQEIRPQARTLASDRGIGCVVVDYAELSGRDEPGDRLF